MAQKKHPIDVNLPALDEIIDSAGTGPLNESDRETLKTTLHALADQLLPRWRTSEKLSSLAGLKKREKPPAEPEPGHGRHKASDYEGARHVEMLHPELSSGCACPDPDCRGKVYPLKQPSHLVRITAMAPIDATVYDCQRLRCNACEKVYTAPPPDSVGPEKYDETVASLIAVFKYGLGIPFNRIEGLQDYLKVPMPASTQWDLVEDAAQLVEPVYEELKKQVSNGDVVHTDDTTARIVKVLRSADDKRTGLHTTGMVSVLEEEVRRLVAVYLTGKQHAGENLRDILVLRLPETEPPVLMMDASQANTSKLDDSMLEYLGNCLAHGRRKMAEQYDNFPDECLHVLNELGVVYFHDRQAKSQGMSPKERLLHHQTHSEPIMKRLHAWMTAQLAENKIESNSGLGRAIRYFLTHWKPLTLFLRHPGAPLDNNIVERALKRAVLHRKNALFYKTLHGAQVGDIFMSIIHTCELNEVNPFEYLAQLQRHPLEVRKNPSAWLPWNYTDQLRPAPD